MYLKDVQANGSVHGFVVMVFGLVWYTLIIGKINHVLYIQVKTERMRQSDI